jgi:tetratricopeptide (TPR) repeat protein
MTIVYILAGLIALFVVRSLILKSSRKKVAKELAEKRLTPFIQEVQKIIDSDDLQKLIQVCTNLDDKQQRELMGYFGDSSFPILDRWAEMEPNSVQAQFFRGLNLQARAHEARTAKMAKDLKQEEVVGFSQYIYQADQALSKAHELDPNYLPVYGSLIGVCVSRGMKDKAWEYYSKAYQLNPTQGEYHYTMLMALTAKWGGSKEEMFNFARDVVKKHPNTTLVGLIARAHIEEWIYLGMCREFKKYTNYFIQDEVKEEIKEAYKALPNELDAHNTQQDLMHALNHLALCFIEMEQKDKAKEVFEKIGVNYTTMPWTYLGGNSVDHFLEYRRKAGLGYQFN